MIFAELLKGCSYNCAFRSGGQCNLTCGTMSHNPFTWSDKEAQDFLLELLLSIFVSFIFSSATVLAYGGMKRRVCKGK